MGQRARVSHVHPVELQPVRNLRSTTHFKGKTYIQMNSKVSIHSTNHTNDFESFNSYE